MKRRFFAAVAKKSVGKPAALKRAAVLGLPEGNFAW
jgi:hypothetical protein